MTKPPQPDSDSQRDSQQEMFKAETQWFHLFKAMIESGDAAKMGPYAFTVYAVIKAHANFETGNAFPAIETIAAKSGISVPQVKRELKTLEACGYLTKKRQGRSNVYTLREKVEITDEQGRPTAMATWDYLPGGVKHAVADLKNVLLTGDVGAARMVHIERLTVNVAQAGGVVLNIDGGIPEEVRHQIAEILKDARKR